MKRCIFNLNQIRQLEENLYVTLISNRKIQYKEEFEVHAVRENLAGKRPIPIFEESHFDVEMIDKKTKNEALK